MCDDNPCINEAVCKPTQSGFVCQCPPGKYKYQYNQLLSNLPPKILPWPAVLAKIFLLEANKSYLIGKLSYTQEI